MGNHVPKFSVLQDKRDGRVQMELWYLKQTKISRVPEKCRFHVKDEVLKGMIPAQN